MFFRKSSIINDGRCIGTRDLCRIDLGINMIRFPHSALILFHMCRVFQVRLMSRLTLIKTAKKHNPFNALLINISRVATKRNCFSLSHSGAKYCRNFCFLNNNNRVRRDASKYGNTKYDRNFRLRQ